MQAFIPSHFSTGIHLFKYAPLKWITILVRRAHGLNGQRMVADRGARGLWVRHKTGLKPFQVFQTYTPALKEDKPYVPTLNS